MISVVTTFFQGRDVNRFSRCFTESWVDKLYRGISRNLDGFQFICFTDKNYIFKEDIIQLPLLHDLPAYMPILEIFRMDLGRVLFMGLDTVITGDLSEIASYDGDFAMIRDPFRPERGASGVMSFPYSPHIWQAYLDGGSGTMDQEFLHGLPHKYLNDIYPGQMGSYKKDVKINGLNDLRIVYFHGREKPHEIEEDFVDQCWV